MLGAIAGDVIGSVYEREPVKTTDFALFTAASRFTDDTVLTVALAEALLDDRDPGVVMRAYHARYPDAGFGPTFRAWVQADPAAPAPRSDSNGAAMRISPVGHAFGEVDAVLAAAARLTVVTHDHPEAVRGAQATALAVLLARHGETRAEIRRQVERRCGYDLSQPLAAIRPGYRFELACAATVPPAIRAFLEADDYEGAVRNAVSLGGDADTLACIAGAIAEAHGGGVPEAIARATWQRLDDPLRAVVARFAAAHGLALPAPAAAVPDAPPRG